MLLPSPTGRQARSVTMDTGRAGLHPLRAGKRGREGGGSSPGRPERARPEN